MGIDSKSHLGPLDPESGGKEAWILASALSLKTAALGGMASAEKCQELFFCENLVTSHSSTMKSEAGNIHTTNPREKFWLIP
jgi:hypothetical protein